ncbi:hypothetical protein M2404_001085 [Rheinheimera pacifica]|uniref:hypothetical protein n=1 Tax=Rheinheimera pacifica TaxID=173990 RepID=UPI00216AB083|nr:hypothetical protein [Rheinheimera pacifica]MCS4306760.1 hypothetical protein [Rheinheimera pacifica]
MRAVFRYLLFFFLVVAATATKANTGEYLVYSDPSGNIYLQAPKQFVLIHGEVAVPLLITPKNGLLKLAKSDSSWQLTVLTPAQWQLLQLTPGSAIVKSIGYADFDGDGLADIRLIFNNGQPAITVTGLTTIVKIITPVVTYLHTDVLGSVIAESDGSGNIIKKTDYKPFGDVNK